MESNTPMQILFVDFNQSFNYLAVGLSNGFNIFRVDPFSLCFHRDIGYKVTIIRMSYETNLIAFVGNKNKINPRDAKYFREMQFDDRILSLWDDNKKEIVTQFTFHSKIKNIYLTREQLYVIFKKKIYIYDLFTYQNIDIINTYPNPKGFFTVTDNDKILAYQDELTGMIRVRNYETKTMIMFKAYSEELYALMTMNSTGQLLAVANKSGTIIYVFSTENGKLLQELKRGMKEAEILSINFDENNVMLAASSHKGTVHIWSLQKSYDDIKYNKTIVDTEGNQKKLGEGVPMNRMSMWNKIVPKYQKEKSFAQMHLSKEKTICCFNPTEMNKIIAINQSGNVFLAQISFDNFDIKPNTTYSLYPNGTISHNNSNSITNSNDD